MFKPHVEFFSSNESVLNGIAISATQPVSSTLKRSRSGDLDFS